MIGSLANKIPQVRVITNTFCGKHCKYCRPSGESSQKLHDGGFALLRDASAILLRHGHIDFRLTGGDPLLASVRELCCYIKFLKENGASKVSLVTRHGKGRSSFADLRRAGLDSITLSIDSLDLAQWLDYCGLTEDKAKEHAELVNAAEEAQEYGFSVSINCVVLNTTSDEQLERLLDFACRCKASLKLEEVIRDLGPGNKLLHRSLDSIVHRFRSRSVKEEIVYAPGGLGHPMVSLLMDNGATVLFKQLTAGSWYSPSCHQCKYFPCDDALMALRLQPTGGIQVCLKRSDNTFELGENLRTGDITKAYLLAGEALNFFQSAEYLSAEEIEKKRAMKLLSTRE